MQMRFVLIYFKNIYIYFMICHRCSDDLFARLFRMGKNQFAELLRLYVAYLPPQGMGRPRTPIAIQCGVSLIILGSGVPLHVAAAVLQVSETNAGYILHRFVDFVIAKVGIISWPKQEEQELIAKKFAFLASKHDAYRSDGSIPKFIGAVDGTYIHINSPLSRKADYINRKGFPSFVVQAVCDPDYRFIHFSNAMPGRMKDPTHYQLSGVDDLVPANFMLLGDAAYGLSTRVLTPYRNFGGYSARHARYDHVHSSMRICIEQSFGMLKCKWAILQSQIRFTNLDFTAKIIHACFRLHNWLLPERSDWPEQFASYDYFNPNLPISTLRDRIRDALVE